jgi:ATP-dependent DNA helicase RecQ
LADLDLARDILRTRFGFADFLPGQAEPVAAALDGDDVFVLWPTGAGKSLVYQLPALARPGLTLVVSPLVALIRDQVQKLSQLGLPAAALHADLAPEAWRKVRDGLENGRLRLLYLSPERLADPEALASFRAAGVRALAIDEAHCVSQWGHDFRPDYRRIAAAAAALGQPQIIATTATASPQTRADIVENRFTRAPRLFVGSFQRPSIALSAIPRARDGLRQMRELVAARRGKSGIVYCATRETADAIADALAADGHRAASYHAGLAREVRVARQDDFLARSDSVMAATIAFGLGVDKPDVRFVLHYDPPDHLQTLYQETGRAGRDGAPAEAIAFYPERAMTELRAARFDLARVDPSAGARARALSDYFRTGRCREQALLAVLGDAPPPCGRCDNCRRRGIGLRRAAARPRTPRRRADPGAPWPDALPVDFVASRGECRSRFARLGCAGRRIDVAAETIDDQSGSAAARPAGGAPRYRAPRWGCAGAPDHRRCVDSTDRIAAARPRRAGRGLRRRQRASDPPWRNFA